MESNIPSKISYQPIGIIHTSFSNIEGMPIQPVGADKIRGTVEIFEEYSKGLKDLDGFSHIILIYHFHQAQSAKLIVTPFLDTLPHGVFSTRAPRRPNPIGLSVVRLLEVEQNILRIENVDILNDTPLLDLKPYVPEFDQHPGERIGWLKQAKGQVENTKSDDRFV